MGEKRTAVIAGVGSGLSGSIARKLADERCSVGLFARSEEYITELGDEINGSGGNAVAVPTDITSPKEVKEGFERVREEFGSIDVLINHASSATWEGLYDQSPEDFKKAWQVDTYGSFLCSKQATEDMLETDGGGTIIFTGATSSIRGRGGAAGFSSAKFASRGLAESMARELGPRDIHVAHVVIDGMIDTPRVRNEFDIEEDGLLDPDDVAESYWHLIEQDRSSWTLELDLRPYTEEF